MPVRSPSRAVGRLFEGLAPRDLIWVSAMSLMLSMLLLPFASYVAALPFIQDEWGINNTQAGVIFSAFQAGFAASALLVIPLTDRFSSRHILVASAATSAIGNALFPLAAQETVTASLLRGLAGAGLVGVYVPGLRVIAERFADRGRGMAMGLFVTAFYAGNGVSLVATGWLLDRLEWRDAYLLLSLASLVSLPLAWHLLRGPRPTVASGSSAGRLDVSVLRNRRARIYILGYTLHAAELYIVRGWLPAFLTVALVARGMGHAQAVTTGAAVGGIALGVGALGPVMGGMISDRLGRASSAAAIFALSGACSWLIGWIGGFPWPLIVAVAVVYGWAIAADSAIYSTAVTEVAKPEQLGSTMAVQSFLGFMGGVVGPILAGGVLDLVPASFEWGAAFSATGVIAVVAVLALARAGERRRGVQSMNVRCD